MAITNYTNEELKYLFNFVNKHNLDVLYVADSYGSLQQKNIKQLFELFDKNLKKNIIVGFHLHNNMNNAYGNYEYLKNISSNSTRNILVDSTMFGMGRGAGNLQTELVMINQDPHIPLNKLFELVEFIQDYIKPIYKISENFWGYDLDYLLSGHFKMHPNYVVKMRDLQINMKNRFYLIRKLINDKQYDYKFFDINVIYKMIEDNKNFLL